MEHQKTETRYRRARSPYSEPLALGPRVPEKVGFKVRTLGGGALETGLEVCLPRLWAGPGATHT